MRKLSCLILCLLFSAGLKAADTCKAQIKANFTVSDACSDEEAVFSNTSAADSNLATYFWDFRDGVTSGLQNPKHIYFTNVVITTYNVQLRVNLQNGCTDTVNKTINIYPKPDSYFKTSIDRAYNDSIYNASYRRIIARTPVFFSGYEYEWTYLHNQKYYNYDLDFDFSLDSINKSGAEKITLKLTTTVGCTSEYILNTPFVKGSVNTITRNRQLRFINPTVNVINIYNTGENYSFQLFDVTGKLIHEGILKKGPNAIEVNLPGVYMFHTTNNQKDYYIDKIVVE